jgi:hypothetical protein
MCANSTSNKEFRVRCDDCGRKITTKEGQEFFFDDGTSKLLCFTCLQGWKIIKSKRWENGKKGTHSM